MICYKCDMCLTVHDSAGEMTNLVFSHAGTSSINFPKNGKFHLCNECKSKLLNNLHAFGYKSGQADREETVEEEHKICIGDVVITPLGTKGIVIGIGENASGIWASVYSQDFDVPQMEPLYNLKFTGKHVDIINVFEKIFNHIEGDEENENS